MCDTSLTKFLLALHPVDCPAQTEAEVARRSNSNPPEVLKRPLVVAMSIPLYSPGDILLETVAQAQFWTLLEVFLMMVPLSLDGGTAMAPIRRSARLI